MQLSLNQTSFQLETGTNNFALHAEKGNIYRDFTWEKANNFLQCACAKERENTCLFAPVTSTHISSASITQYETRSELFKTIWIVIYEKIVEKIFNAPKYLAVSEK